MYRVTKKIFKILTPLQQRRTFILAVMMLIGGIMESMSVSMVYPLIDAVMDPVGWADPWYAQLLCGIFGVREQRTYIEVLLVLLILLFIVKNVYLLFEVYIQSTFVARSRYHMQIGLMRSYMNKPYCFFLDASTGEIMRIITGDTGQTFQAFTFLLNFYTEAMVGVALAITVAIMSPKLAFGMFCILILEVLAIGKIIKPIMRRVGIKYREESSICNKWMLQGVTGIKSIKVSNTEEFFCENYRKHSEVQVDAERKNQTLASIPKVTIEAFTVAAVLGIMLFLVMLGQDLEELIPQLSAFVVAAVRLLPCVNRMSTSMNQIPFLEGAIDNVINTMESETVLHLDKKDVDSEKADRRLEFAEDVCLDNVTFAYPNSSSLVLQAAGMSIRRGQSVGVVGPSGAGKTTAIDIMLGLLKPQEGKVVVDGTDIEENLVTWRSKLAYIPQSIFLMDDSIKENVAFGHYLDEIDEDKVWKSLADAQMEEFVRGLPDGIDTEIGEAGVRLSGGQRQRIGIARALYNDPDILFFDEATSALDNDTEAAIMESIENLKGHKTLVIIAHRLSTIENCDVVYKVENGKINKI